MKVTIFGFIIIFLVIMGYVSNYKPKSKVEETIPICMIDSLKTPKVEMEE